MRQTVEGRTDGPAAEFYSTDEALLLEFARVLERRTNREGEGAPEQLPRQPDEPVGHYAGRLNLTALCLSGGGIRSAAFSLGVIETLARNGLLGGFDYLSTVSGGGFIGGWLQMLLQQPDPAGSGQTGSVEDALTAFQEELGRPDFPPLSKLRAFTNYLAPEIGPFSSDTWAAIALYLRNLILTWTVFAPLFLGIALTTIFYRTATASIRDADPVLLLLLLPATIALGFAVMSGAILLPSHRRLDVDGYARPAQIKWRAGFPVVLWAALLPPVIDDGLCEPGMLAGRLGIGAEYLIWIIPALYAIAMLAGYWIAWSIHADPSRSGERLYVLNAVPWLVATLAAAFLVWLLLWLLQPSAWWFQASVPNGCARPVSFFPDRDTMLATLLPFLLIGIYLLQTTFYVGLRRQAMLFEIDREWLARLSGVLLRVAILWPLVAICCLVLPLVSLLLINGTVSDSWLLGSASGTVAFGGIAALLGKTTPAQIEAVSGTVKRWPKLALSAASLLFGVGLLVLSGTVLQSVLGKLQASLLGAGDVPSWKLLLVQLPIGLALFACVWIFGHVNVNRFSMHAVYRNRLTRAFLGSARNVRTPDLFTGFDEDDNPRLIEFANPAKRQRLLPVINMTLNVTSSSNTAWAERQAESFVANPFFCGAGALHRSGLGTLRSKDVPPSGVFVPTSQFAGMENAEDAKGRNQGPHFGSMLTISGAAISPNWGYHSSRATAFLMTLFNARLGAWAPNPAVATPKELQLSMPKNSVQAILDELIGSTTDTTEAVYLSDGGHFDNLGIYEMLRRRCMRIVVVDAGADPDCTFFDLGNAMRKAEIDLNALVTMGPMHIYSRQKITENETIAAKALGYAMGTISYPECPDKQGLLLYIKPSFLPDIPTDALAYGLSDLAFPNDNTADQWFSESQFESYRVLGQWQMARITDEMSVTGASDLGGLFQALSHLLPG